MSLAQSLNSQQQVSLQAVRGGESPPKNGDETRTEEEEASTGTGTFVSAAFTVFNSAVGTGILTLPFSFKVSGVVLGGFALLFFAVLMAVINCILAKCSESSGTKNYQSLVKHFLGPRASVFMSVLISVYCFFACVGGLIIVGDVTHPILSHINADAWFSHRQVPIALGALLGFPLMCLRDITSLRFSAMTSFAAIMYVVCVIVWFGADAAKDPQSLTAERGPVEIAEWKWTAFLAIPNIFLSFQCQIQIPSIYAELRPEAKNARTMVGVIATAQTVIVSFYVAVAFCGYYTFRHTTPPNIMEANYDQNSAPILVARLCLAVTAVCSLPINHFPARSALFELYGLLKGRQESELASGPVPQGQLLIETGMYWVLMLIMGLIIPNLDVLNNILGTTAGVSVIFLLPGLLILKQQRPASLFILSIGVVAFVVSASDFVASTFFGAV